MVVDAKEVKRVIIVPAEEEYGDKVPAILNKVDGKENCLLYTSNIIFNNIELDQVL